MNIVHIDELELIPVGERGLQWRPVRSRFGISAFGTNAYTADVGDEIVEEHTEGTYRARGDVRGRPRPRDVHARR